MSSENAALVRDVYEAVGRGDWGRVRELVVPGFEWETDARLPNAGIYTGEDEVRRFMEDQAAAFEEMETVVERTFESGDQVVAFIRVRRRIRGSSADFEITVGHLWALRDGKAVRCQAFARREDALEAAGIPEP